MHIKCLVFVLFIACAAIPSIAQKRDQQGYKFSNEEMKELLLFQSKQHKTKGIVALISGPAITALGLHLININKNAAYNGVPGSGGYNDGAVFGYTISTLGVSTSISSIAFFVSSSRLKKRARLLSEDDPTRY